jgi:hypothetical protein
MTGEQRRRDPDLGAAYAGIAVGALAVLGATAVGLRWAARPPVRRLTVGRGGLVYRGGARRR